MSRSSPFDVCEVARRVAEGIGDGTLVLLLDPDAAAQEVVAVAHRDPDRRRALAGVVGQRLDVGRDWSGHVATTGRSVRIARERTSGFVGTLLDADLAGLLYVPLRVDGGIVGTVVAVRDRGNAPYSLSEQVVVERLVTRVANAGRPAPPPADADELAAALRDRSDAAVWATDLDGCTLAATPAMCELLAVPVGAIARLPMSDFVEPTPHAVEGALTDEAERGDRRLRRADGGMLWVATSSTPLLDAHGRRRGTLTTFTDVTERKQREVALRLELDAARWLTRLIAGVLRGDDPGELLDGAAEATVDVLGVRRAGVFELRGDGTLLLRAGCGWPPEAIGRLRLPLLGSPAALALTMDEPVVVTDADDDERLDLDGVRSGCWVRIARRGVLAALHDEPRDFGRGERDLLSSLAEALSGCVGIARQRPPRASQGG